MALLIAFTVGFVAEAAWKRLRRGRPKRQRPAIERADVRGEVGVAAAMFGKGRAR